MTALATILSSIRARARELGLSDAELARRAGLTPEALSRLSGRQSARFDTLEKLAQVVGRRLIDAPMDDYVRALTHGGLLAADPAKIEPSRPAGGRHASGATARPPKPAKQSDG